MAIAGATIIEATANDILRLNFEEIGSGAGNREQITANTGHMDIEYLGTGVNAFRYHDSAGGSEPLDDTTGALILGFDSADEDGTAFTASGTDADRSVTINESGLYYVAYSSEDDRASGTARGEYNVRLYIDPLGVGSPAVHPSCQGNTYNRGDQGSGNIFSSGAGFSCLVELTATDIVDLRVEGTGEAVTPDIDAVADKSSFVMLLLEDAINSPPNTPTDITCDGGTCNTSFDASVTLAAVGTDDDGDNITFEFEATLDTTTLVSDPADDTFTSPAGSGGTITFDNKASGTCDASICSVALTIATESDMMIVVMTYEEGPSIVLNSVDEESNTAVGTHIANSPVIITADNNGYSTFVRIMDADITNKGGINTITTNWASAPSGMTIIVASCYGVDQNAEDDESNNHALTLDPATTSVTPTEDGSVIITNYGNGQGTGTCTYGTGQIELLALDPTSAKHCTTYELQATAAADTQSVSFGTVNRALIQSAAFAPAS